MSASKEIPNVGVSAHFDTALCRWIERKRNQADFVFASMVSTLHARMGDRLRGLARVELYGVPDEQAVFVKCIRGDHDHWQERWLFDLGDPEIFFFPHPA